MSPHLLLSYWQLWFAYQIHLKCFEFFFQNLTAYLQILAHWWYFVQKFDHLSLFTYIKFGRWTLIIEAGMKLSWFQIPLGAFEFIKTCHWYLVRKPVSITFLHLRNGYQKKPFFHWSRWFNFRALWFEKSFNLRWSYQSFNSIIFLHSF